MGCDSNYPILRCSVEVITAFNPEQVILMIRGPEDKDAYLRFWPEKGGAWRLAGSHLAPVKELKSQHQMDRTSGIPYLRTIETGIQEPGRSSTDELWFDLRKEAFDPVFKFESHASNEASKDVIDCKAFGRNISVKQEPRPDSFEVRARIHLTLGGDSWYALEWAGTYRWKPAAKEFQLQSVHPAEDADKNIPVADFKAVVSLSDPGQPTELLVHYILPDLGIDISPQVEACLASVLKAAKDTPEVRELKKRLRWLLRF